MKTYNITPTPRADCFLCQYQVRCNGGKRCLLTWPPNNTGNQNCSEGGLWSQWEQESDVTRCAELARQIRDLPEREEELIEMKVRAFGEPGIGKTYPPPPPKLTRAEAIDKTREQWRWHANNPSKRKIDFFVHFSINKLPYLRCYLCEFARKDAYGKVITATKTGVDSCGKNCPLQWPGGCCELPDGTGLYDSFIKRFTDHRQR